MTPLRSWRVRATAARALFVAQLVGSAALGWLILAPARAQAAPPSPAPLPPASPPPTLGPGAPAAMPAHAPAAPGVSAPSLPAVPPAEGTEAAVPEAVRAPDPAAVPRVVATSDLTQAESDHDAVVGAWGVEVRPVATTLPVFARRASTGCPLAPAATPDVPAPAGAYDCPPVSVSMLGVRHWMTRNFAVNAGVALALGGGSQGDRLLDSYFGFGPALGLSVLLGNWRHLTVAASPSFALVWFKAAGSADATYTTDVRADLEGEVHFGFIGLPALSVGIRSGVLLRLEKSAELSLWSLGVTGATSPRGLVSDLTLRYYF